MDPYGPKWKQNKRRGYAIKKASVIVLVLGFFSFITMAAIPELVEATTDCTFTTSGTTMFLDADCTTDETIFVPDEFTLNGRGNAITAVDPSSSRFMGGVVEAGGVVAHVTHLVIHGNLTDQPCNSSSGPDERLRGILFDGASGSITHNTIQNINKGNGCQEGNAIEIRNAPFDGTHPATIVVEIAHNLIEDWQKTGIVANGDVDVWVHHNVNG